MRALIRPLLVALQFLTAIPIRMSFEVSSRLMGRAMAWFPLVGLVIGGILGLVDLGLRWVLPPTVRAALVVTLWVMLTGALHLDGLMDCCDGLLAARAPERRLDILRDSRVGAFAVVGAVCLLLVKFAAVSELSPASRLGALFVVPALSRAAVVYAVRAYPYARPGPGLGQIFRDGLTWREVAIAAVTAVLAALVALGWLGVVLAGVIWVITAAIAWWVRSRIPGLTGDVYGAINELTELGGLLFVLVAESVT